MVVHPHSSCLFRSAKIRRVEFALLFSCKNCIDLGLLIKSLLCCLHLQPQNFQKYRRKIEILRFKLTKAPLYFRMSAIIYFLCLSLLTPVSKSINDSTSLYLSPTIFFPSYQNMLNSFKIYIYTPSKPFSFPSPIESLFFTSLQASSFVTQNPEEAHLFFVPFASNIPTRSIARFIRDLRMEFPYWNRTLGADHFYVSCTGLGYESDRNLVELKKNSVQISCSPVPEGKFVPHKDITLPPLASFTYASHAPGNKTTKYLVMHSVAKDSKSVNELRNDSDFLMESEPSNEMTLVERLGRSMFCLFEYGADISGIGKALRFGCVPVMVTDHPMQDLPLMDVLNWQKIVVFVGSGGGVKEVKRVLDLACSDDECEGTRRLGTAASQHFGWNEIPEPYDSFYMVIYQLWLRRHTIRYPRREFV